MAQFEVDFYIRLYNGTVMVEAKDEDHVPAAVYSMELAELDAACNDMETYIEAIRPAKKGGDTQ